MIAQLETEKEKHEVKDLTAQAAPDYDNLQEHSFQTPVQHELARDISLIRDLPLFRNIGSKELQQLRSQMDECSFKNGAVIVDKDHQDKHFHVLTSGAVEFLVSDGKGGEMVVAETHAGGVFGELSLLSNEKHYIKVRAKGDATLN